MSNSQFSSFSAIDTILYSFAVPVLAVPSELNSCNAQITSAFGAELKAEDTVKLETLPAEVETGFFSTLTFSDQKFKTFSPLSSTKFAASSCVSNALPSAFSSNKSPVLYVTELITAFSCVK